MICMQKWQCKSVFTYIFCPPTKNNMQNISSILRLKECPVPAHQHLINMGTPYMAPPVFLVKGFEQVLVSHKPFFVGDQPEFIRPIRQDIGQHAAEFSDFSFLVSFAQIPVSWWKVQESSAVNMTTSVNINRTCIITMIRLFRWKHSFIFCNRRSPPHNGLNLSRVR